MAKSNNEFRNQDVVLKLIHEKYDALHPDDQTVSAWKEACEKVASEMEAEGLSSSAEEARKWQEKS